MRQAGVPWGQTWPPRRGSSPVLFPVHVSCLSAGTLNSLGSWPETSVLFAELPNLILVVSKQTRLWEPKQERNRWASCLFESLGVFGGEMLPTFHGQLDLN